MPTTMKVLALSAVTQKILVAGTLATAPGSPLLVTAALEPGFEPGLAVDAG